MTLNQLRKLNRHIVIKGITNRSFIKYGKIITGYDFTEMIKYGEKKTPVPEEGNVYIPSIDSIESLKAAKGLKENFFGDMDIQIGYYNGSNSMLNYMEYHRSSEIIIAVTDIIIFLGRVQDIKENQYEANKIETFFVPEGVAVELYGTVLHSSPCKMESKGFRTILVLPRGTNLPLREGKYYDDFLHSRNRWIIVHPEARVFANKDSQISIVGENTEIIL